MSLTYLCLAIASEKKESMNFFTHELGYNTHIMRNTHNNNTHNNNTHNTFYVI